MKLITLVRHAKALPLDPNRDCARALSPAGREAAIRIGQELQALPPDLVLCSPSVRTRETLELAMSAFPQAADARFEEELYLAHASTLARRLSELPEPIETAWLVGHNPGLHDLVRQFSEWVGSGATTQPIYRHFPPASYATFGFDTDDWGMLETAQCSFEAASQV